MALAKVIGNERLESLKGFQLSIVSPGQTIFSGESGGKNLGCQGNLSFDKSQHHVMKSTVCVVVAHIRRHDTYCVKALKGPNLRR